MVDLAKRIDEGEPKQIGGRNIGGSILDGDGQSTLVHLGENCMMNYISMKKGFTNPGHVHEDHEGMGYVLSGRIDMRIRDRTYQLTAGSTWYHPRGHDHSTFAVEDSVVLEFHTPLRQDILDLQ